MTNRDLKSMSVDELWSLHKEVDSILTHKMLAEKARLEQRMRKLAPGVTATKQAHARRPYPPVFPKYRNPAQPGETWAGRGLTPRWLAAQLRSGKKLDDFRIEPASDRARRATR
jgi:DNA-binding protein H-NS